MKTEKETIPGFDIVKRELTEEEATREISLERFQEWHQEIGEDFVDQVAYIINAKIFCGFLLAKYPLWNKEILENVNDQKEIQNDSEGENFHSGKKTNESLAGLRGS